MSDALCCRGNVSHIPRSRLCHSHSVIALDPCFGHLRLPCVQRDAGLGLGVAWLGGVAEAPPAELAAAAWALRDVPGALPKLRARLGDLHGFAEREARCQRSSQMLCKAANAKDS